MACPPNESSASTSSQAGFICHVLFLAVDSSLMHVRIRFDPTAKYAVRNLVVIPAIIGWHSVITDYLPFLVGCRMRFSNSTVTVCGPARRSRFRILLRDVFQRLSAPRRDACPASDFLSDRGRRDIDVFKRLGLRVPACMSRSGSRWQYRNCPVCTHEHSYGVVLRLSVRCRLAPTAAPKFFECFLNVYHR